MPDQAHDKRPHLVLTKTSKAQPFTAQSVGGGNSLEVPEANSIKDKLGKALFNGLLGVGPSVISGLGSGLPLRVLY